MALILSARRGWLPKGFTELEFLESSGRQVLSLPFSMTWDTKVKLVVQQVDGFSMSPVGAGGADDVLCYEVWYSRTSGSTCGVRYGIGSKAENFIRKQSFANRKKTITVTPPTWSLSAEGDRTNPEPSGTYTLQYTEKGWSSPAPTYVFGLRSYPFRSRVFSLKLENDTQKISIVPVLDANGTPCMYDKISRQCFYNSGTGDFIAGLTLRQARELRLPSGGGSLTLSLPYEASVDAAAQAALERARAAGWTLTLQYREGVLPAGYRKLEFLESTGTQYILIPDAWSKSTSGIKMKYEYHNALSHAAWSVREETTSQGETSYYNVDIGRYSTTGVGAFVHAQRHGALIPWVKGETIIGSYKYLYTKGDRIMTTEHAGNYKEDTIQWDLWNAPAIPLFANINQYSGTTPSKSVCRIYWTKISSSDNVTRDIIPILDGNGTPCMFDTVTATPFYNSGIGAFIAGLATIDDVRTLYLAPTGGSITLSVPAETPQGYIAALQRNNPNWTISIQYRES